MSKFELPMDDLRELQQMLEEGHLVPLRDRRTKQPLERYTSRIWLFPFGLAPGPNSVYPVQIFRNGSALWMGKEVKLVKLPGHVPLTVAVFRNDMREDDLILAEYLAVPSEEP